MLTVVICSRFMHLIVLICLYNCNKTTYASKYYNRSLDYYRRSNHRCRQPPFYTNQSSSFPNISGAVQKHYLSRN